MCQVQCPWAGLHYFGNVVLPNHELQLGRNVLRQNCWVSYKDLWEIGCCQGVGFWFQDGFDGSELITIVGGMHNHLTDSVSNPIRSCGKWKGSIVGGLQHRIMHRRNQCFLFRIKSFLCWQHRTSHANCFGAECGPLLSPPRHGAVSWRASTSSERRKSRWRRVTRKPPRKSQWRRIVEPMEKGQFISLGP